MSVIAGNLSGIPDSRLTLIELQDGVRSPAGPLNHGLSCATTEYVTFVGSDDELEPGSLDSWLREVVEHFNPEVLVGQLRSDTRGRVLAPLPRIGRFRELSPVQDLLNNRTAPVGALIRRDVLERADCPRFSVGLAVGEDINLGLYLWNKSNSIAYSRVTSGYLIHEEGDDRVTGLPMPFEEILLPVERVLEASWLIGAPPRQRASIGVKLLRYQVLAPHKRRSADLSSVDAEAIRTTALALLDFAPTLPGYLSPQEADQLSAIMGRKHGEGMAESGFIARCYNLSTRNLLKAFTPESGIRRGVRLMLVPKLLRSPAPIVPPASGNTIVLFTSNFPFARGEEFIEPEIKRLSSVFEQVIVVPLSYRPGLARTRDLPSNATVVLPNEATRSGNNLRDLLRFASRHPLKTLKLLRGFLPHRTRRTHLSADLQFDFLTSILAESVSQGIRLGVASSESVLFYSYWLHTQAMVALKVAAESKTRTHPVVSRAHRGDLYAEESETGYLPKRHDILERLTAIYCISQDGARYLSSLFPEQENRIHVARLGTSAAKNPGNPSLESRLLVSCSTLMPVKRLELLVAGISEAQAAGTNVRWVHIGAGTDLQEAALNALACARLSPGSYEFLGAMPNAELRRWYGANPATGFINVSSSEGVPVTIMEAIAQGLPVIATDVGGTRELFGSNMYRGLLPPNPSHKEVARSVNQLFSSDPKEYSAWVDASLSFWTENWSEELNLAPFAEDLAEVARRSTPTGEN